MRRIIFGCALCCSVVSANAALVSVLGGQAVQDTDRNIMWVADSNLAQTNQFGLSLSVNSFDDSADTIGSTGRVTWANAQSWIAGMNAASYLGFNDWRLPNADINGDSTVVDCNGGGVPGCADNEMGFLFWEQGISYTTPGPFSNIVAAGHWFDTEIGSSAARVLALSNGQQFSSGKTANHWAFAVRTSVVPIPAAVWLFGSALGLLGWMRRKTT